MTAFVAGLLVGLWVAWVVCNRQIYITSTLQEARNGSTDTKTTDTAA